MMLKGKIDLFQDFFKSEKAGGLILIFFTILSLIIANSGIAKDYLDFWHSYIDLSFLQVDLKYSIEHWINDGLMAIFFLLVGLEIERELYVGELSSFKNAILPILAAAGGMIFPALIHFIFNSGTPTQYGFGIPMATDIAFALGILSLAGKAIPVSLKIFLTALAIIDDLGAITIIAIFYTKNLQVVYLLAAIGVFLILLLAGFRKVYNLVFYIIGGIIMWYCMLKSGVHATIAGVLLAFAIPFHKVDSKNPSYKLQHILHYPVAFLILPLFALSNTAITFPKNLLQSIITPNSLGILFGLVIGKFLGIFCISLLAVRLKLASLSADLTWRHVLGISLLGGIGFTMSIFIANLAFTESSVITSSKIAILLASVFSAIAGLIILKRKAKNIQPEINT